MVTVEFEDNPPVQVEVLDSDTVSQAKDKIMEVLFKVEAGVYLFVSKYKSSFVYVFVSYSLHSLAEYPLFLPDYQRRTEPK